LGSVTWVSSPRVLYWKLVVRPEPEPEGGGGVVESRFQRGRHGLPSCAVLEIEISTYIIAAS